MSGEYWVYWDKDIKERVRVHAAWCHFCNGGRGIHDAPHTHSEWLGPFTSAAAAQAEARQRQGGKRAEFVRLCGRCSAATEQEAN
jgi:hypothetical protein